MTLELHHVTIDPLIRSLSLTADDGRLVTIAGAKGSGKTTLLRAILGFLPIDGGHICIDGELLTPLSAPYFRRFTAYVPQRLSVPDDCRAVPTGYVELLRRAVESRKPLLLVDEPLEPLSPDQAAEAERLLRQATEQGSTVVAVNAGFANVQIRLGRNVE